MEGGKKQQMLKKKVYILNSKAMIVGLNHCPKYTYCFKPISKSEVDWHKIWLYVPIAEPWLKEKWIFICNQNFSTLHWHEILLYKELKNKKTKKTRFHVCDTKSCYIKKLISCPGSYNVILSFPQVNDIHSFVPHYSLNTNYVLGTVSGPGDPRALFLTLKSFHSCGEEHPKSVVGKLQGT